MHARNGQPICRWLRGLSFGATLTSGLKPIASYAPPRTPCDRRCDPHLIGHEKTCPTRILCTSDYDDSAGGCVLGDDRTPHADDGPGRVQCGRIPAHGGREGGGSANLGRGRHAGARPDGGVGTVCRSCASKREAAASEGIDNDTVRERPGPGVGGFLVAVSAAGGGYSACRAVRRVTAPSWPAAIVRRHHADGRPPNGAAGPRVVAVHRCGSGALRRGSACGSDSRTAG
jgi:hypothetical protein